MFLTCSNNTMSENQQAKVTQQETPEEIAAVITELEQYKQRIIDDTLAMAKRAKILRATTLANLENNQEIAQVDAMIQDLRDRKLASELHSTAG